MSKRAIQATVLSGLATLGVAPGATITIKDAVTGANRTLWSDFAGTSGTGNPVTADVNGQFLVYANPGRVQITVTDGVTTRIWEDVELGHEDHLSDVINGDFTVAQRGTSFAAVANDETTLDLWVYRKVGTMVHTVSQDADIPTQAEADDKAGFSLKVDCTTADAAIAAGDLCFIGQRIEGYKIKHTLEKTITRSFWVKATKTGIYCVAFRSSGADRSYVVEYTVFAANTWEFKTITIVMHDGTGIWDFTNGVGLRMDFVLAVGSTFQTTPGAWQVGNFLGTSNQVNACDDTANNFQIALVNQRVGNVALPFQHLHFAQELALCKRYFEILTASGSGKTFGQGHVFDTDSIGATVSFLVEKRAAPTVTFSAVSDFRVYHGNTNVVCDDLSTLSEVFATLITASVAGTPLTVGGAAGFRSANANAEILISAEL